MSKQELVEVLETTAERFNQIAPKTMSYEAEKGFAVQILNNNSYLKNVAMESPISLQQAVTNVAAIGLSLNPAKRQAYLIARTVKTDNGYKSKIFLEPGYMGLCDLATESGGIQWIQANVVYSNDTFMDNGPGERPTHTYNAFAKESERGTLVGVYCAAKTSTGDYLTTTMPIDEVYGIRDRSEAWKAFKAGKAKTGGPWQTDFNEQAKKTVVRRAFKMWPKTNMARMAQAVLISNENEGFEPILTSPNVSQYTAEQKAYFDQLIEQSDAMGMHSFSKSLGESLFTNLYHSFEKGQKGKYQRMVDELCKNGQSRFIDVVQAVEDASAQEDDLACNELINELDKDSENLLMESLSKEALAFVKAHRESA